MEHEILTEDELLAMVESDYMNASQKQYFRKILSEMHLSLKNEIHQARQEMNAPTDVGDTLDLASNAEMLQLNLRTTERKTKLLHKIEAAISRIDNGVYGYCIETKTPIGLKRLLARPTATLSIDSKEQQEFHEKTEGISSIGGAEEENTE
jgi:DnaK suppressor protein